jgi:hypothetical protein
LQIEYKILLFIFVVFYTIKKKVFLKKKIADGLGLGLDVQREQKNRKKRNI